MQNSMKNSIDYKFRIFLLELCEGRELTVNDIRKVIKRDYKEKDFSRQRINELIKQFVDSNFLTRNKIEPSEDDKCKYSYTTTKRGMERIRYYQIQLLRGN